MSTLKTSYMGLELNSPVVVGACDLVENSANLVKMEKAGAGAIIYKSIFEEQVQLEDLSLQNLLGSYNERNAEMTQVFPETSYAGPDEFLEKLQRARKSVGIPVIGSLNAIHEETWVKYAQGIEQTGVQGIELNFYNVPFSLEKSGTEIEDEQVAIAEKVVAAVNIPVSVKLSPYYTNVLHFITRLEKAGVKGIVLFNKMFQPDIDIEKVKHVTPWNLSHEKDYRLSLRYSGLLYGRISSDLVAGQGIMEADDVIRLLLAGAGAVQVVSTLYKNGIERIDEMNSTLKAWMQYHKYSKIDDFRGLLSRKNTANPMVYKRAQYIDMMLNSNKIFTVTEK